MWLPSARRALVHCCVWRKHTGRLLPSTAARCIVPAPPHTPPHTPLPPRAARTHRELFSLWYADLLKEPLEELLAVAPRPPAAERFFGQMMRDINGACQDPVEQVRGGRAGLLGWRGGRRLGLCVGEEPGRGVWDTLAPQGRGTHSRRQSAGRTPTSPIRPPPTARRRATPWATTWPLSTWRTMRRRGCWTRSARSTSACWRPRAAPSPSGSSWRCEERGEGCCGGKECRLLLELGCLGLGAWQEPATLPLARGHV